MVAVTYTKGFAREARDFAVEFGGLTPNPEATEFGHNDAYDAYRHALMSGRLADKFGEDIAKHLMDEYERRHPNPPDEKNMDLWNNDVGRQVYREWKRDVDTGIATPPLEKRIYDAVKEGRTINEPSDSRSWTEPPSAENPNGDPFTGMPFPGPDPKSGRDYSNAQRPPRKDPLTLDLDGDGLETIATSSNLLFDHNGDGIKTSTGSARVKVVVA